MILEPINFHTEHRPVVYGDGPSDADILILGEAPGREEAEKGRPFVGKAGNELDTHLHRAQILRRAVYITNVIKERPDNNKISEFIKLRSGSLSWMSEKAEKYLDYLRREIAEVNPNVIVPVGNVAMWAVANLGSGITKWRGSILESTMFPGKKVIPTIHPAAPLHGKWLWRYSIQVDLIRVRKESQFPEFRLPNRHYIIEPNFRETMEYLEMLKKEDIIAFDIEADKKSQQMTCISFAPNENEAISIPFVEGANLYFPPDQELEVMKSIGELLENDKKIIAHNSSFDTSFMLRRYGIKTRNIEDTMVAHAVFLPDLQKSLAYLTSVYTKMPYYKDVGANKFSGRQTSDERFWTYNAKDSIVLMEMFPKLMEDLKKSGNYETYQWQKKLIEPLLYVSERGIKMDIDAMRMKEKHAKQRMEEINKIFSMQVGREFNCGSHQQLKWFFYEYHNIQPYVKDKKPTTNEDALKRLAAGTRGNVEEEARLVLEYRKLSKSAGTYYGMNLDEDHRMRCSMNPVGAKTGRLSSSKTIFGTGANMQNQPWEMKYFMLVDEG